MWAPCSPESTVLATLCKREWMLQAQIPWRTVIFVRDSYCVAWQDQGKDLFPERCTGAMEGSRSISHAANSQQILVCQVDHLPSPEKDSVSYKFEVAFVSGDGKERIFRDRDSRARGGAGMRMRPFGIAWTVHFADWHEASSRTCIYGYTYV